MIKLAIVEKLHRKWPVASYYFLASVPGSHPARTASDKKLDESLGPRLLFSALLPRPISLPQGVTAGDGVGAAAAEEWQDSGSQDSGWQEESHGERT